MLAAGQRTARAALAAIDADWTELPGPGRVRLESRLREHLVAGEGRKCHVPARERQPRAGARGRGYSGRAATYSAGYVAHAPLEPRAALARWSGDELTVWTATSTPFRARQELAAALGVPEAAVQVVVPDFGGGFGGKHGSVVALEAARLARAAGQPVQVAWTRAEEFTAGYLRPAAVIDVASSAMRPGELMAWSFTNINSGAAGLMTPYRVPHQAQPFQPAASRLAQGSYRALAATANNFARESPWTSSPRRSASIRLSSGTGTWTTTG